MISFKTFHSLTAEVREEILDIQSRVFDRPFSAEHILAKVADKDYFQAIHAYKDNQIVGFKTGFSLDKDVFYSWIGGVDPSSRGLGIAKNLMSRQHEALIRDGFSKVQTKTQNKFKAMLILNLKFDFDIVDTFVEDGRGRQILLEKKLNGPVTP